MVTVILGLTACQSTRLNSNNSAQIIEPRLVTAENDLSKLYLWGGEILEVNNLKDTTELTIISYPLDYSEKPKHAKPSTGRFIAEYNGFLEPTDYKKGTLVSMIGTLTAFKNSKVASTDYQFPVLSVDKVKLLGKASRGYRLPFSIGIGIGIHN